MTYGAAISAMRMAGACLESSWPYDLAKLNEKPPDECFVEAAKYRVVECQRIPVDLECMREVRAEGHPIIFGLKLTDSFPQRGGMISTPDVNDPMAVQLGCHAMCIVG